MFIDRETGKIASTSNKCYQNLDKVRKHDSLLKFLHSIFVKINLSYGAIFFENNFQTSPNQNLEVPYLHAHLLTPLENCE